MSNRAWMPLHIDDYIRDTDHLSATEHGAYLLLIMKYWRDSGLPSDEGLIRRYAKLSSEQWAESRDVLAALFEAGWSHKRIDAELLKADDIIEKRRSAAKGRHGKDNSNANAEQMQSKCNAFAGANADTRAGTPLTNNLSDASASDGPVDFREKLWTEGVASIARMTGKTESSAKSMIGKWLRDAKDDCRLILQKIHQAETERIGDPISWVSAAIRPPPPKPKSIGEMFREDARQDGIIPHEQPTSTADRRLGQGDGPREISGSGVSRSFAVSGDILGRIG